MIFYRVGNMLLFIFVVLLLFGSFWHLYIWSDFFLRHTAYTLCLAILSALAIWIIVNKINNLLRENTLNNILKDMNSYINPEMALRKYVSCIVDWKRIDSPVRAIYRLILNPPLGIWNYHLAEEIVYDQASKSWKLLGEPGKWQVYTGPEVPDEVPIGECRKCNHQIYKDDLEELNDKEMGLICIECGSTDIDFGET
jgi:hypothetical protein